MVFYLHVPNLLFHRLPATGFQVSDWRDWEDEAGGKATVAQVQQTQVTLSWTRL